MFQQQLADALVASFETPKVTIFASFSLATDDLRAAQAAAVPAERFNSVWAIVNHVWFWTEGPLRVIRGEPFEPDDLGATDWGGWVPAGDPQDEEAWQVARQRAISANAAVAATLASLSPAVAERPLAIPGWGTPFQVGLMLLSHNSYHINEIISTRHMQGLWLERS